jgi:hypothetical protein
MAAALEIAELTQAPGSLGVAGVQEPRVIQYEGSVWSCREKREIRARLYYSLTSENGRNACRLLFIEPLL